MTAIDRLGLLFQRGQFLRPDMLFVPATAAAGVKERGDHAKPGLVIEVLSKHSKQIDRVKKPPRYRDFGVDEYWVVDHFNRCIERYRLAGNGSSEICRDLLTWQPDSNVAPLRLEIPSIFPARKAHRRPPEATTCGSAHRYPPPVTVLPG